MIFSFLSQLYTVHISCSKKWYSHKIVSTQISNSYSTYVYRSLQITWGGHSETDPFYMYGEYMFRGASKDFNTFLNCIFFCSQTNQWSIAVISWIGFSNCKLIIIYVLIWSANFKYIKLYEKFYKLKGEV